MFIVPELYRVRSGRMGTDAAYGNNGAFDLTQRFHGKHTFAIASDQEGWEHVSVSHPDSMPTWEEMCIVKDLFWDREACVMQLHPPARNYVNNHQFCLHLWRPTATGVFIPQPPEWMVGIKKG